MQAEQLADLSDACGFALRAGVDIAGTQHGPHFEFGVDPHGGVSISRVPPLWCHRINSLLITHASRETIFLRQCGALRDGCCPAVKPR
jgi:hypothetical protein